MANTDEQAIRELIDTWMRASRAGDTATVLSLMTDDVVFMTPGREPFGKEAFAAASAAMTNVNRWQRHDRDEQRRPARGNDHEFRSRCHHQFRTIGQQPSDRQFRKA